MKKKKSKEKTKFNNLRNAPIHAILAQTSRSQDALSLIKSINLARKMITVL